MANEQNLKPVLTKKEARERGSNGGKASVKVKKKKKQVKDLLQTLLAAKANPKDIKKVQSVYSDLDIKTIEDILNLAMIREGSKGNVQAYNAVYDRIEGKAPQKVKGEVKFEDLSGMSTEEIEKRAAALKLIENASINKTSD